MTLSEAIAAKILHCDNSGIRPPEALATGRFAYYPILIITHFFIEIQKPSIALRDALRERALSSQEPRDQVLKQEPNLQESKDFFTCGEDRRPTGGQNPRRGQDRSKSRRARVLNHRAPR